jgi:response regulator RpfG family c-di-GMP phosphodiesterase
MEHILCVDDEPNILRGIKLNLRSLYKVTTAESAEEAIKLIGEKEFAIVLSDMNMPGMNGIKLLKKISEISETTVRILLTGEADLSVAIGAINDGRIFRFLTKPCDRETLQKHVEEAVEHYKLITSQKILLEETLKGSVKILIDILGLASPEGFGRAKRIKQMVSTMLKKLGIKKKWDIELAAMLSQIGCITLPTETIQSLYYGKALNEQEQVMVSRLPTVASQLLKRIPRLETIRAMLSILGDPDFNLTKSGLTEKKIVHVKKGAEILKIVCDYCELESRGLSVDEALNTLSGRSEQYSSKLLDEFISTFGSDSFQAKSITEVSVKSLNEGMVLAEDLMLTSGQLLIAKGYEITEGLIEKLRNISEGNIVEPLRVYLESDFDDQD